MRPVPGNCLLRASQRKRSGTYAVSQEHSKAPLTSFTVFASPRYQVDILLRVWRPAKQYRHAEVEGVSDGRFGRNISLFKQFRFESHLLVE